MKQVKFIIVSLITFGIIISCQTNEKYKDVYKEKEEKTEQEKDTKEQYKNIDTTNATIVTMDGYDPSADIVVKKINVWGDYEKRTFIGSVSHGDKVKMLKREGDAVLIRTSNGVTGWVTYWFIKELK